MLFHNWIENLKIQNILYKIFLFLGHVSQSLDSPLSNTDPQPSAHVPPVFLERLDPDPSVNLDVPVIQPTSNHQPAPLIPILEELSQSISPDLTAPVIPSQSISADLSVSTVPSQPSSAEVPVSAVPFQPSSAEVPVSAVPYQPSSAEVPVSAVPSQPSSAEVPVSAVPSQPSSADVPVSVVPFQPSSAEVPV